MKITLVCHKYGVPLDDPCCYPLGFMYVSATLKKLGHTVKILNYNLWDYDLAAELAGQDCAFFTGFEEFYPLIQRDAALCRELGVETWVGGALATFKPEVMAKVCDVVITGEFGDADLPDYVGFGIEEYHRRHKMRYMGVLTSLGCPYHCTFCAQTCSWSKRPLSEVFREVDLYRERYGVELIVFNDNTLNTDKRRTLALCQGMQERGIKWSGAFRLDNLDDEVCAAVAASSFGIIVGVESFSQARLDALNKHLTVGQITTGLDLLHKHGVRYYGNILVGFDGQTNEEIAAELALVPEKYNLLPALVRHFVGTQEGGHHGITEAEWQAWDQKFRALIAAKGMYCYPELEGLCV